MKARACSASRVRPGKGHVVADMHRVSLSGERRIWEIVLQLRNIVRLKITVVYNGVLVDMYLPGTQVLGKYLYA